MGGVNDSLIKGKNWIWFLQQMRWDLIEVRIQTDAQKGLLLLDLAYERSLIHELSESFGSFFEFFGVLYQHELIDDLLDIPIHDVLQVV